MFYTSQDSLEEIRAVKKQVIVFLAITFAVTYISNFIMLGKYGLITQSQVNGSVAQWQFALALQMLFPAFSAIACLVIFKDKGLTKTAMIFLGYFMLYFVLSIICIFYNPGFSVPSGNPSLPPYTEVKLFDILTILMGMAGIVLFIVLNVKKEWRQGLKPLKLSLGRGGRYYLIIPAVFIVILTINFYLNRVFGLGVPIVSADIGAYLIVSVLGLVNALLQSWMYFLGEEFGWRVFLQDRLVLLFGRVKGVLILGVIWGLWHAPIIAMGYNYPGQPVLGVISMTLFTVVMGIIISFSVFKTGSVWMAVLMHLIINTLAPSAMMYIANPANPVFSFGLGIYGIAFMAIFAVLLFISGEWRNRETGQQE